MFPTNGMSPITVFKDVPSPEISEATWNDPRLTFANVVPVSVLLVTSVEGGPLTCVVTSLPNELLTSTPTETGSPGNVEVVVVGINEVTVVSTTVTVVDVVVATGSVVVVVAPGPVEVVVLGIVVVVDEVVVVTIAIFVTWTSSGFTPLKFVSAEVNEAKTIVTN